MKSFRQLAREVLKEDGKPLHYKEITRRVVARRKSKGATPGETIRSAMSVSDEFIRIEKGVFALAEWEGYKEARFAKDIAYDILKQHGSEIKVKELGLRILYERKFLDNPSQIARNSTRKDSRFYYTDEKKIGLTEWL